MLITHTIATTDYESLKGLFHIIAWGVILRRVIAGLLRTKGDGFYAIKIVKVIGDLPFSGVMAMMGIAMIKAFVWDGMRNSTETKQPNKVAH